jgi:hypothetical protein
VSEPASPAPGGWFPTGATPTSGAAVQPGPHSPFPATGATVVAQRPEADVEEGERSVRRRHPYTWLHLIVLALVAFVLGFLVVALWNQGRSNGAGGDTGAAAGVVAAAPPGSSYAA